MCIIEGSLEVNFRQYGEMKSRDGKSQREERSRRDKITKLKVISRQKGDYGLEISKKQVCKNIDIDVINNIISLRLHNI